MTLKQWLANHSKLTHSIVGAWGVATMLFATDPAFKKFVWRIYQDFPPKIHEVIAGLVIPLLLYWQSQRSATVTTVATPGSDTTVASVTQVASDSKEV